MARPATGQIVERQDATGAVRRSLRFRAGGHRHTVPLGVVSRAEAERELAFVMADVARGVWQPRAVVEQELVEVPTFHEFSEQWWVRVERQLAESTKADYRWRLESHLLPYFGEMRLDTITFDTVERYIAAKLAEDDPLSPRSINMTVTLLGAILEGAVERELIARNPARGRSRRVRERAPVRSYLDAAAQIRALLDAAAELDREAPRGRRHVERRAMIATLIFAGLRISELLALCWRDVDLAGGWLHVGDAKTDAGRRRVKIRGALRDELVALRGRHQDAEQAAYVFPTASGSRQSPDNFRARVLGRPAGVKDGEEVRGSGAIERANTQLEAVGLAPLPAKLTPHSLRRTFCSLLYALGEDPGTVMDEMGHTDPGLALRVYRQAMRRGEDEKAALAALVAGGVVGIGAGEEVHDLALLGHK
ncbi:MAG TPA: site-specific integrase [Solirubrobacteraceae bacterium]|jgi:integrase|nr:site-specific integrase [Solirubrobacteraceae bacterium]